MSDLNTPLPNIILCPKGRWWKAFIISLLGHGCLAMAFLKNFSIEVSGIQDSEHLFELCFVPLGSSAPFLDENALDDHDLHPSNDIDRKSSNDVMTNKTSPLIVHKMTKNRDIPEEKSSFQPVNLTPKTFNKSSSHLQEQRLSSQETLSPTSPSSPLSFSSMPLSSNPSPEYPEQARQQGIEGTVHLKLKIDSHGKLINVQVLEPKAPPILEKSALLAVKEWSFHPSPLGLTQEVLIPIHFQLDAPS